MSVLGNAINTSRFRSVYRIRIFPKIKQIISPNKILLSNMQNKNRHRSASLTAEAALALPVLFYTSFILWQCFLLLLLQISVCQKVTATALTTGSTAYLDQAADNRVQELLYKTLLWDTLREEKRMEELKIAVTESEKTMAVNISYCFLCESGILPTIQIPVRQSFLFVPYYGEREKDLVEEENATEKNQVVYVTKSGTVYHESKACSYLSVTVSAVRYSQIDRRRNSSGKKYTACGRCREGDAPEVVYVSLGGEHFHQKPDCPSLKRVVQEKNRDEVALPACSKCGKENGS